MVKCLSQPSDRHLECVVIAGLGQHLLQFRLRHHRTPGVGQQAQDGDEVADRIDRRPSIAALRPRISSRPCCVSIRRTRCSVRNSHNTRTNAPSR